MKRLIRRHLPVVVFGVLVLVIAVAGVAFGGSNGTSQKKVKRIATQQINKLAPGLSVAHAGTADTAVHAGNASDAANAAKVDGADVCSTTFNVHADAEDHPLCAAGPLIVSARCNNQSSTTQALIRVSSTQTDSWAFGTATDGGTVVAVGAPFLLTPETVVDVSDNSTAPTTAEGGATTLSVGTADGATISGTFSVRADHTAANQGTCFATVGATAS
jgi:ABC-type Na+ efflux pump permease subunit